MSKSFMFVLLTIILILIILVVFLSTQVQKPKEIITFDGENEVSVYVEDDLTLIGIAYKYTYYDKSIFPKFKILKVVKNPASEEE